MNLPGDVVIFDGDCAFCNRSALFILRKDKTSNIYACSNQSEIGLQIIKHFQITESPKDTLIFIKDGKTHYRSNAALSIATQLNGGYPLLYAFKIIPRFIRDGIYNIIAKHRHKLLKEHCELIQDTDIKSKILT